MANKPQKPVDQLQFRRGDRAARRTLLLTVDDAPRPVPPVPRGTQRRARERWRPSGTSLVQVRLKRELRALGVA